MKQVVRLISALAFLLLLGSIAYANEFRGLYVDAFHPGFKSHTEVTQMVNAAHAANFNALIVQVRKRGNTYYASQVELKAHDIAADYDPLADIITQAHAAGMEVHAWLSVYEVTLYRGLTDAHVTRAHPDWLMMDRNGKTKLDHGKIFTDPGVPAVQAHFLSIVREVAQNYDVDGIHLDCVRYPDKAAGYNSTSVSRFNAQFSRTGTPADDDADWCQWRRNQITDLIDGFHDVVAAVKPAVKLSASVMTAQPSLAVDRYLQDWGVWLQDGLLDFVVPMIYTPEDKMQTYAPQAMAAAHERHVYIGIGAYRLSPELAAKHITDARTAEAKGVVLYSYDYLGPNGSGNKCKLADLAESVFTQPATPPAMTWKEEE